MGGSTIAYVLAAVESWMRPWIWRRVCVSWLAYFPSTCA